ncbi:MAG: sulfatase/phosphatase domain-containing protein, partial [Rubrobacter sp.]
LAPTFASWAGITSPGFVDGRSLVPLLTANPSAPWRDAFLVEHRRSPEEFASVKAIPNYYALRTSQYSYTEYATGERELYRLDTDPYELNNVYRSASSTLVSNLHARLNALKRCGGTGQTQASCERAEGG